MCGGVPKGTVVLAPFYSTSVTLQKDQMDILLSMRMEKGLRPMMSYCLDSRLSKFMAIVRGTASWCA